MQLYSSVALSSRHFWLAYIPACCPDVHDRVAMASSPGLLSCGFCLICTSFLQHDHLLSVASFILQCQDSLQSTFTAFFSSRHISITMTWRPHQSISSLTATQKMAICSTPQISRRCKPFPSRKMYHGTFIARPQLSLVVQLPSKDVDSCQRHEAPQVFHRRL